MTKSKIVTEAATLSDAVQKAARVAPTKGSAFDRFAGIYVEVSGEPMDPLPVTIRSTNGEVTYQQKIGALEYDGPARWRIPAVLFAGLMSTLPLDSGRTITLIGRDDPFVGISAGSVKAKFNLITGEWPIFPDIEDITTFSSASDFASKADQVAWATHPSNAPLAGVHLDGKWLIGCNKYVMARIPCTAPIQEPLTVPLKELSRLIAHGTDVKVKAHDGKLYIMLDAETQATTTIYGEKYPNIEKLVRTEFGGTITFQRQELIDAIQRMLVLVKGERYPKLLLKMTSDGDGGVPLVLDMDVPGVGRLQDTVDTRGEVTGDEFEMWVHPIWLQDALNGARSEKITMGFGPTALHSLYIKDEKDYEVACSAIRKDAPEPKKDE